jgi:hypothetical protein
MFYTLKNKFETVYSEVLRDESTYLKRISTKGSLSSVNVTNTAAESKEFNIPAVNIAKVPVRKQYMFCRWMWLIGAVWYHVGEMVVACR